MMEPQTVAIVIAAIFGPAGAAWIGVKTSLNGVKQDIQDIKRDVRELREQGASREQRLSFLEGRGNQ